MNTIFNHRSIRKFTSEPIDRKLMFKLLEAAGRASTTGNMQLYSIIISESQEMKERLSPLHFNQPCVKSSAAVITFCADINRFSKYCTERGADPYYDNFAWFINGAIDALLAAQNFCLEAESNGLGICYLGTTTYNAEEICSVLELPKGVLPVTTVVVGYPDGMPELTDRLPVEAIAHYEKYKDYSGEDIDNLWREKENLELTKELIKINNVDSLAHIFTEKRYKKDDNLFFSEKYLKAIINQGFFNNK